MSVFKKEPGRLDLLRSRLIRNFAYRGSKHYYKPPNPASLLPMVEMLMGIFGDVSEEFLSLETMQRDWVAELRRQGMFFKEGEMKKGQLPFPVPASLMGEGEEAKSKRAAAIEYARDLGYRSLGDMLYARIIEPAIDWKRRKTELLEETKGLLEDS